MGGVGVMTFAYSNKRIDCSSNDEVGVPTVIIAYSGSMTESFYKENGGRGEHTDTLTQAHTQVMTPIRYSIYKTIC